MKMKKNRMERNLKRNAENALIVKEKYEITEKDRKTLRNAGIFLNQVML